MVLWDVKRTSHLWEDPEHIRLYVDYVGEVLLRITGQRLDRRECEERSLIIGQGKCRIRRRTRPVRLKEGMCLDQRCGRR
jgi:hypothetical protein